MDTNHLILQRWSNHPEHGSLGELFFDGVKISETIERPWQGNKPYVSCIPAGTYELFPYIRNNGDHVYALYNPHLNVYINADDRPNETDRFSILIHIANWAEELSGCIAPGSKLAIGRYRNKRNKPEVLMVYQSAKACEKLFKLINEKEIKHITILNIEN